VFLLAGRYTLLEQAPLDDLLPMCVERGISVILGGVFNSGILATGASPGANHNYLPADSTVLARVAAIENLCTGSGVPIAAAALQLALAHPAVASVVLGASTPAQQASNIEATRTVIPQQLWDALREQGHLHPEAPIPPPQPRHTSPHP
jgi:D-threo-aldose 1-dehydrogenase